MNGVKDKSLVSRAGACSPNTSSSLVGLVVFVLAVNGALETWISYRATKATLTDAMSEKAEATARADRAVDLRTRTADQLGDARQRRSRIEQRRADYAQLLNQVPAVSQLFQLGGSGRELLRLSRARSSTDGSTATSPATCASPRPSPSGVSFSPAYFRDERPFDVDLGGACRLQRRRHGGRDRPALPVRLPWRRPGRQGHLRLCGGSARPGAGELPPRGPTSARISRRCRRSPP